MKISPIWTSIASVSGSGMMMVLAALKPGIAPTTIPTSVGGTITHQ
jgi:hypothetical protein